MEHERQKPDHISQQDWDDADIPEMTDEEFARARPMAEVHAERVTKNKGGRPKLTTPTIMVGWRFPVDLVEGLRGTGRGYTDRIEALLRQALSDGRLQPKEPPPAPPTLF